jgi:hypothetical protein
MQHEIPESKLCPNCGIEKTADQFHRNAARHDGLTYVCAICINDYESKDKKPKRFLADIVKECSKCKRQLLSRMYVYSQNTEDHLKESCRTCSSYKKSTGPSDSEIEEYESFINNLLTESKSKFDLEKNRSEFEQYVWQNLLISGLLVKWKPPVWVHKTSIPE